MYQAIGAVAGAGLSAYGAHKQKKAMGRASDNYNRELQDYYGQEQASNADFQRRYEDIGDRRLSRIGGALDEYMATPYGQTGADTATADQALASVQTGNPGAGMGGAATGWGNGVAARTADATGRQRMIAGDANQISRQGQGQSRALGDQGIADMGFQRETQNLAQMEQLRQRLLARHLQTINANGQGAFEQASRSGSDLMAIGGALGAGGGLMDSFGGGAGGASAAAGGVPATANPNWGPSGQQSGGGYYGSLQTSPNGWGASNAQRGGGYYGALFR